jgi:hypothetical protein
VKLLLAPVLAAAALSLATSRAAIAGDEALPLNPLVDQSSIEQTICLPGWSRTVRPPQSTTKPIKLAPFRGAALPDEAFESAILDHRIPIELGGSPDDARNLALQEAEESREKDGVEHCLRRAVCLGVVTLEEAQTAIWHDWRSAMRAIGRPPSRSRPEK